MDAAKAADAEEAEKGGAARRAMARAGHLARFWDVRHRRPPRPKASRRGARRGIPRSQKLRGGERAKKAAATVKDPMQIFISRGKRVREAPEKFERRGCRPQLREIAREFRAARTDSSFRFLAYGLLPLP